MSQYLAQARTALRKVENDESLDKADVAIIVVALDPIIRARRTPFQRFRDHYIIGTEKFKVLDGLDYYKTILMHRKTCSWHTDSSMSELSIREVYTASQLEPPQAYNDDPENGTPDEYAFDLLGNAHLGPSSGSSHQDEIDIETAESYRNYVADLKDNYTFAAMEEKQEIEFWLRKQTPDSEKIKQGDLVGIMDAYIKKFYFWGKLRAMRGPSQDIADSVRHATTYARKILRENPKTADIADYLERHCRIGQICEYTGDWRWRF